MKKWLTFAALALLAITNAYTLSLLAIATERAGKLQADTVRLRADRDDAHRVVETLTRRVDADKLALEEANKTFTAAVEELDRRYKASLAQIQKQ